MNSNELVCSVISWVGESSQLCCYSLSEDTRHTSIRLQSIAAAFESKVAV